MKFSTVQMKSAVAAKYEMTDVSFLASMTVLEDILDASLEEFDVAHEALEVRESFETLDAMIANGLVCDAELEAFARTTPGLKELASEGLENFKSKVHLAATEGVVDGMLGDWNTGPIGAIIAFKRSSIEAIKQELDLCKEKLAKTEDRKIETVTQQAFIRVRSKYLPKTDVFFKGVDALSKMFKAVASNPNQGEDKYIALLKGSMFFNNDAQKKQGNQDTNWKYAGIRLLPTILGTVSGGIGDAVRITKRFWFEPAQPVGERGWNNRNVFEQALDSMKKLVADYEAAAGKVISSEDKTGAGAPIVKWGQKEVVYLGRGLTTAIRKLYASGFVRLISNRVIH